MSLITKKNDTMNTNDESEAVVKTENDLCPEDESIRKQRTERVGISNIKRSLTLKKKIVFKEKPIKWTDRIAMR